jgi:peroxiredoxin
MLQRGEIAPDFELPALIAGVRQSLRLSSYRGRQNLVLAFYPSNWEPVSTEEMIAFQVERENFLACDTEILAICTDSIMNTTAWEREIGPFDFPLCSDFWPHGEVSLRYGVLRQQEPFSGTSGRATLIVNKAGVIEFAESYAANEVAPVSDALKIVGRLNSAA